MLHSLLRVFHANDGQHGAKGLQVRRVGEPGGRERVSESHRAAGKAMPPRLEAQSMFNDSGGQHPHQPNARGRLPPLRPSYLQHSAHLLPGQAHVGGDVVNHHRPDEVALPAEGAGAQRGALGLGVAHLETEKQGGTRTVSVWGWWRNE